MLDLYIVGCGGIGGYLIDMLPMCLASLSLDLLEQRGYNITKYLENAGNEAMPLCVNSLTLIDGDTFDPRNALRQGFGAGGKLVQRMRSLNASMLRRTFLRNLIIQGVNAYVNPDNMSEIILKEPKNNPSNRLDNPFCGNEFDGTPIAADAPVIFLGVDNAKTRYEISKYAEEFRDILVINGGNEKTTGQVTVYERRRGEALDPNLYEVYSNIRPDVDERPDEAHCTGAAPKHDQVAVTNSVVADTMLMVFNKWARSGVPTNKAGQRINTILIDTDNFRMSPLAHPKTKGGEE